MIKTDEKILIIGSCTGTKKFNPENIPHEKEMDDLELRKQKEEELKEFKAQAYEMYQGKQHLLTLEAFNKLKNQGKDIDFWIVSAAYGLIRYSKEIIPYEVTFAGRKRKDIIERGKKLNIPTDFDKVVVKFDKVIVLLSKEYLLSLNFPRPINEKTKFIFLGGKDVEKLLLKQSNITFIPAGNKEAKRNKAASIYLKGVILNKMVENGEI